ncbi:transposase [Nocardia sp. NPDC046473]|uniref:transposase n=1 Tax=Nocardia sp. NPDC046473 TaxID=3155733 RepID=UPI0033C8B04E
MDLRMGAVAILAETGDPARFPTARAIVEHAGLAPREKKSGTFTAAPGSPEPGAQACGWLPGEGAPNAPTWFMPPATGI